VSCMKSVTANVAEIALTGQGSTRHGEAAAKSANSEPVELSEPVDCQSSVFVALDQFPPSRVIFRNVMSTRRNSSVVPFVACLAVPASSPVCITLPCLVHKGTVEPKLNTASETVPFKVQLAPIMPTSPAKGEGPCVSCTCPVSW